MNLSRLAKDLKPYVIPWIVDAIDNVAVNVTVETGGGGSTGTSYSAGDGIDIASSVISADVTDFIDTDYGLEESSNNIRVNLAAASGLEFSSGELQIQDAVAGAGLVISSKVLAVNAGDGIAIDSDAVVVDLAATSGLEFSSGDLQIDDDIAGAGLVISSKVLAVNVGDGLEIDTDAVEVDLATNSGLEFSTGDLALGTPTTLAVGTSNSVTTTTHAHAITSTADGAANHSTILQSGTSGELTLDYLTTPLILSASDLTLQPDDDLWLDPANQVLMENDQEMRSETYMDMFAGIAGFRIWESSTDVTQLTIGKIKADELHVRVFVADENRVDRGAQIWSKSYGIVAEDFVLPADEATVDVWFENAPDLGAADLFSVNDWLLCRTIDWAVGLVVSKIWFQVTTDLGAYDLTDLDEYEGAWSASTVYAVGDLVVNDAVYYECLVAHTAAAGDEPGTGAGWNFYWTTTENKDWQQWRLRRKAGGDTDQVVKTGVTMVDVGVAGQGFVELSALETDGGPYIQLGDWATDPSVISNWDIYTRIGNLSGLADYSTDTWGLAAGKNLDSATEANWQGIFADDTNGIRIYQTALSLYDDGYLRGKFNPSGTFFFGNPGATTDVTGANAHLLFTAASGDLRIGAGAGQRMYWDNSAGTLTVTGKVVVQSGSSGIASFSDANLDNISDGSTYGRISKTIITNAYVQVGSGTKDDTLDGWNIGANTEIVGQLDGVDQVTLGTDGRIKAGAGAVWLDGDGIGLYGSDESYSIENAITFGTVGSSDPLSHIYHYYSTVGSIAALDIIAGVQDDDTGLITLTANQNNGSDSMTMFLAGSGTLSIDHSDAPGLGHVAVFVGSATPQLYLYGDLISNSDIDTGGSLTVDKHVYIGDGGGNDYLYLRNNADTAWINSMYVNASDNLIIGNGLGGSNVIGLAVNASSRVIVRESYVEFNEPIVIDGGDTITSNPAASATAGGWKLSLYSTTYAIGVATSTLALKSGDWVAAFDGVNPAGDATATEPDTAACFAVNDAYMWTDAALGQAWNKVTIDDTDEWANKSTATYHGAQYKKFGDMVMLRGVLQNIGGGVATNDKLFNLPAGYRPAKETILNTVMNGAAGDDTDHPVRIQIEADGDVHIYTSNGDLDSARNFLTLDGLWFSTAAALSYA